MRREGVPLPALGRVDRRAARRRPRGGKAADRDHAAARLPRHRPHDLEPRGLLRRRSRLVPGRHLHRARRPRRAHLHEPQGRRRRHRRQTRRRTLRLHPAFCSDSNRDRPADEPGTRSSPSRPSRPASSPPRSTCPSRRDRGETTIERIVTTAAASQLDARRARPTVDCASGRAQNGQRPRAPIGDPATTPEPSRPLSGGSGGGVPACAPAYDDTSSSTSCGAATSLASTPAATSISTTPAPASTPTRSSSEHLELLRRTSSATRTRSTRPRRR